MGNSKSTSSRAINCGMPICGEKPDYSKRRKHGKNHANRTFDFKKSLEAKEALKQMQEELAFERYQEIKVRPDFCV